MFRLPQHTHPFTHISSAAGQAGAHRFSSPRVRPSHSPLCSWSGGSIFGLSKCVCSRPSFTYTLSHTHTHVHESHVWRAPSWRTGQSTCCSRVSLWPGSPSVLEKQLERDVCPHSASSRDSGGNRWLSGLSTGAVLGRSCSLASFCPAPVGLPQFGHLSVPEYLIRVPGHHLGFPPPAVSGHQ